MFFIVFEVLKFFLEFLYGGCGVWVIFGLYVNIVAVLKWVHQAVINANLTYKKFWKK